MQFGHKIRDRDTSLSSRWRNDALQEICTLQHNSLHNAQASRFILCHFSKGFAYTFECPFRRAYFNLEDSLCIPPNLRIFWASCPHLLILGGAVCVRTIFHLFQKFFGKRLLLPLSLYPSLLFLLSNPLKNVLLSLFQERNTPTFLVETAPFQLFPQSATMRLLFLDCLPLARLQRRLALCRQSFVVTLLTQIDRAGLLNISDNYRSKLPESEGFVTAAIVAQKKWSFVGG